MSKLLLILLLQFRLPFNEPDRAWQRIANHNKWMYQIDNRPWKTWIDHSLLTVGVGSAIGLLPNISKKDGMVMMVEFYFIRELYTIVVEGNRKYVDSINDVLFPFLTVKYVF